MAAPSAAGNGHGNSGGTKLDRLLTFHEEAAAAIRRTIELMNGHALTGKANGHATVLAQAVALDGARVAKKRKASRPQRGSGSKALLAQRRRTVKVLDAFSTKNPIAIAAVAKELGLDARAMGLAPLIHHGYLKQTRGGGILRTAKAYQLRPRASE